MESAKKFVIDIVTWNSVRHLPDLFASIDDQTSGDFTVTVVDNASADETVAWLQENRSDTVLLRNFRNQGFARAHNQGISLALSRWEGVSDLDRRYIFLLNPDTILDATCVAQLISFMDTHPDVDIAGPKLLRAIRTPRPDRDEDDVERTGIIDSVGISILRSRRVVDRGAGEEDTGAYDREEPFGITGATMLIRASAIRGLCIDDDELFDEDFFAYKEDADLSWRARLLGRQIAFVPHALAWHCRTAKPPDVPGIRAALRGQRERASAINRLSTRNQVWMEWKNDDMVSQLLHLPWRIPEFFLRFGAAIVFPSRAQALIEAWLGRGRMRAKRQSLMARRKVDPAEMRKWFV